MTNARRLIFAAMMTIALATEALAVDTPSKTEAPDLTAIRALIKVKDFAAARDQLLQLADTHQHADIYNLLGFSLRKTGDYRTALTYYQKALDFDANHKGALEYLGELFVETKQPEKAHDLLARLVKLCPSGCEEREDLEKAMRDAGYLK